MESSDLTTRPSVSSDQWTRHALNKLNQGYLLVLREDRRTANFVRRGRDPEMCAYATARKLVVAGLVAPTGSHPLGTAYGLATPAAPPVVPPAADRPPARSEDAPQTPAFDASTHPDLAEGDDLAELDLSDD